MHQRAFLLRPGSPTGSAARVARFAHNPSHIRLLAVNRRCLAVRGGGKLRQPKRGTTIEVDAERARRTVLRDALKRTDLSSLELGELLQAQYFNTNRFNAHASATMSSRAAWERRDEWKSDEEDSYEGCVPRGSCQ